jgi:hypothetical protein
MLMEDLQVAVLKDGLECEVRVRESDKREGRFMDLELGWCLGESSEMRDQGGKSWGMAGSPHKLLTPEIGKALLVQDGDKTCGVLSSAEKERMVIILPKGG